MDYAPMPDGLTPHCALCFVTQDSQFRFIMMIDDLSLVTSHVVTSM